MSAALNVLALYGANTVSFCISDTKCTAKAKQRIDLPRTEENMAFVETLVRSWESHAALVSALKAIVTADDAAIAELALFGLPPSEGILDLTNAARRALVKAGVA